MEKQTFCSQISYADKNEERIWNLPISLKLSSTDLSGWPSLIFKIWLVEAEEKLHLSNCLSSFLRHLYPSEKSRIR